MEAAVPIFDHQVLLTIAIGFTGAKLTGIKREPCVNHGLTCNCELVNCEW